MIEKKLNLLDIQILERIFPSENRRKLTRAEEKLQKLQRNQSDSFSGIKSDEEISDDTY